MKDKDVFYELSVSDIQQVAVERFGRRLSSEEIRQVIPKIEDVIPWYDLVENGINLADIDVEYVDSDD